MRFEWFVAQRYLRSPYRPAVLRLVTVVSMIGVAAGVATLVIALSMNPGFRETLQDRLLGVTAHVSLTRPGTSGIKNYEEMATKLAAATGARSVTPAVYQTVLLSFAGQARGVVTKGIDPGRERKSDEALQRITAGRLDFSQDPDGIDALLIGKQIAEEWKVAPGDYVTLTSPQGRLTPFGLMPRTRRFPVAGVFDSGFSDYDENWCFLTLPSAKGLSGAGDAVHVLAVTTGIQFCLWGGTTISFPSTRRFTQSLSSLFIQAFSMACGSPRWLWQFPLRQRSYPPALPCGFCRWKFSAMNEHQESAGNKHILGSIWREICS